ncbi:unnamed protein product [Absidia cylindrospora]
MKNTDILSAGSKVYEKKRRMKKETVEAIDFDFDKRQIFNWIPQTKTRKETSIPGQIQGKGTPGKDQIPAENKAERQREVSTRLAEVAAALKGNGSDNEDEDEDETVFTDDNEDDAKDSIKEPKVEEFKSAKSLTTVTVIEDFDLGEESN